MKLAGLFLLVAIVSIVLLVVFGAQRSEMAQKCQAVGGSYTLSGECWIKLPEVLWKK